MKRLWIGIALLVIFLLVGCVVTYAFHRIHAPMQTLLEEASAAALGGDWEMAAAKAESAQKIWHRWRNFTATVADHGPLEQMEALFTQLRVYQALDLPGEYAAVCAQLSQMAAAMEESQAFTWWNLL